MIRFAIAGLLAASTAPAPTMEISARSRALQPGELVVLSITVPVRTEHVRVRAFNHDVDAYPSDVGTWTALVGIDLDVRPGAYRVTADADTVSGPLHAARDLAVERRAFPTRRLTVDPAFVTPPASEQERIASDAKLLARVWSSPASQRLWTGPFVRPVPGPANSAFGTRSVFNGAARNPHGGADFLSPGGTPIHAPNDGLIVIARSLYFTGNTVVIDHGLGLFSMLAHLSAIEVHEGDRVAAGQILGLVGATGRVTGPHLHWAVRASGARVDPLSLLALLGS